MSCQDCINRRDFLDEIGARRRGARRRWKGAATDRSARRIPHLSGGGDPFVPVGGRGHGQALGLSGPRDRGTVVDIGSERALVRTGAVDLSRTVADLHAPADATPKFGTINSSARATDRFSRQPVP